MTKEASAPPPAEWVPEWPVHPAADLFPLMTDEEYEALKTDIAARGQQEPIWLYPVEGRDHILDGRNRYRACRELGINPVYHLAKTDDPVAYVLSINLHRRHLTESQRAMVGARARQWYDDEAKKRMSEGGKAAGKGRPKQGQANLPDPIPAPGQARDQAGKAVNVGGKTVSQATSLPCPRPPPTTPARKPWPRPRHAGTMGGSS